MSKFVIDCDPGVDDSLALIYAAEKLNLDAVTITSGNTSLKNAVSNAYFLREALKYDFDIYAGSSKPLDRDLQESESHGESGLGNFDTDQVNFTENEAIEFLENLKKSEVHLICLGPLTNIAKCVTREQNFLDDFKSVTIMGGALNQNGNVTNEAEFNFWCDPKAADIVLNTQSMKTVVPLDVCREVKVSNTFFKNQPFLSDLVEPYSRYYNKENNSEAVMYDPVALILGAYPDRGERVLRNLQVSRNNPRGKLEEGLAKSNTRIFTRIYPDEIKEDFKTCLNSWKPVLTKGN